MCKLHVTCTILMAAAWLLWGCSPVTPDSAAATLAEKSARLDLTQAVLETAQAQTAAAPTATTTQTPTATNTPIPTSTFTPLPTETATPSPTPDRILPGVYDFEDVCAEYPVDFDIVFQHPQTYRLYHYRAVGSYTTCVHAVTVLEDRRMALLVSYNADWNNGSTGLPGKPLLKDNPNVYLTDAQGSRYDAAAWAGDVQMQSNMEGRVIATGYFPPAAQGVYSFVYHDDTLEVTSEPFTLTLRTELPSGRLGFSGYRFEPERLVGFKESRGSDGRLHLTLMADEACAVHEIYPGQFTEDVQGGEIISLNRGKFEFGAYPDALEYSRVLVRRIEGLPITPESRIAFDVNRLKPRLGCDYYLEPLVLGGLLADQP